MSTSHFSVPRQVFSIAVACFVEKHRCSYFVEDPSSNIHAIWGHSRPSCRNPSAEQSEPQARRDAEPHDAVASEAPDMRGTNDVNGRCRMVLQGTRDLAMSPGSAICTLSDIFMNDGFDIKAKMHPPPNAVPFAIHRNFAQVSTSRGP